SDSDPDVDNIANQELLKGGDYRGIISVRGTLAWLLQAIVAQLNTTYYKRAIDLIEKLAKDKVLYVRQQATYPLSALIVNVNARKNKDGTPFDFKDEDRKRVIDLAFFMLDHNRDYPRILEYLAQVFDKMRLLSENDALSVLDKFLFSKDNDFHPYYVTEKIAPALIYFAEYRKDANDSFNDKKFVDLLIKVISTAEPALKSTIVWHIWKTIEENPENYERLKKYIARLFQGDFAHESVGQYDLLVEKIIKISPSEGVELFKKELAYIERSLSNIPPEPGGIIWFHNAEEAIEKVAELDPDFLPKLMTILKDIYLRNGYIGDVKRIFSSYKKAPVERQNDLEGHFKLIYEQMRGGYGRLPPW
ncbi:MAG: hypothetical protein AAB895_04165, partial [Patescibacteria group bacterium]